MRTIARRLDAKLLEMADSTLMKNIRRRLDMMSALACVTAGFTLGVSFLAMIEWFPPAYLIALIVIGVGVLVPALAYAAVRLSKKVKRPRPFHGSSIHAPLYFAIHDVLDQRGITNPKKYIKEHPEHAAATFKLVDALQGESLQEWDKTVALIYIKDEDPVTRGALLINLMKTRGDMPASEYRSLLEISGTTSTPLMDGAL